MKSFECFSRRFRGGLRRRSAVLGLVFSLIASVSIYVLAAQAAQTSQGSSQPSSTLKVPDWAWPGSATHKQIPPPKDFHRATRTYPGKIGIFDGQSDVGAALVPGKASYDAATGTYSITSAGYNIWYTRDEFRFLWKKMSGDISFAGDPGFPVAEPPHDRKVVLVIRQDLSDDSKEIMVAEHGTGMVHLAIRPGKDEMMSDMEYRINSSTAGALMPQRIGIEKHGDKVTLWMSVKGEPMHQFGPPDTIHFKEPFYVGIGFSSHNPVKVDTGTVSHVVLVNAAGQVH